MSKRDEFSASTRRTLLLRVAGLCSKPECRKMTLVPTSEYPGSIGITGRAAHITAATVNGPRYDAQMTKEERRSATNGIWLCAVCADLIDKDNGREYSVPLLKSWKHNAEQRVADQSLISSMARMPLWLDKISTPYYINIPRVIYFNEISLSPKTASLFSAGFPASGYIANELAEVSAAFRRLSIRTVDVDVLLQPEVQVREGLPISFYRGVRTKNGAASDLDAVENYSFDFSPLIYFDMNGFRYIMPFDPRWATSTTARGTLRSGNCTMAGIGIVKSVNHEEKSAICTPLVLGAPNLLGW